MSLSKIISINKPKSEAAENFKRLKTNILLETLNSGAKTIMVTSTGPKEGKSTVVGNIAYLMAQSGKKTIILDCDLKNSSIHKLFALDNGEGISNFLMNEKKAEDITISTEEENLYIITAGVSKISSTELFSSETLRVLLSELKSKYDYIFIDTPSLLLSQDGFLISKLVDGCILVVAQGEIDRSMIVSEKELLQKINTNILGVVMNKTGFDSREIKKSLYKKSNKNKSFE